MRLAARMSVDTLPAPASFTGTHPMQRYLGLFAPTTDQLVGLGALLAVCAGLSAVGAAIGGRRRIVEIDLIAGWAVVSLVFATAGGPFRIGFTAIATVMAAVACAAALYLFSGRRPPVAPDPLRSLGLAAPALWLAACMAISQWDEFTQWVPNARYIYVHNAFPGTGMPETFSVFPAYPHGLAYVIYLTSRIAGHLAENAAGMFNIVLLACFGVMIGRVIRMAATRKTAPVRIPLGLRARPADTIGWVYCALGGLAVTALNPTFVPKIVFTAYADASTAVLVGMLCVLIWLLLNALAGEESEFPARHIATCLGLTGMALVGVKQVNLVLFLLVVIGGGVVAVRDKKIAVRAFARTLPVILTPAVTMYLLWRLHISMNGITGEFSVSAYSDWLVGQLDVIVSRMLLIASKKGGYFLTMAVACGFAVRALWQIRTPFDRLSLIVATVFAGYTVFLLFAYVAAFNGGEALRAASYWRYNMHLGGACVAFGAYGLTLAWQKWIAPRVGRNLGWAAIAIMLAAPFAAAKVIRFDARPQKLFARAVAESFTDQLPANARLAIFDLTGDGSIGVIVRYAVSRRLKVVGEMTAASNPTVETVSRFVDTTKPDFIWVHVPTDAARKALGVVLPARAAYLLRRTGGGWAVQETWPYPGYDDPNALPD